MSVVTLFTREAPTLAGIQFDAVLEDTLELSVEYTGYTIETGAPVKDHGIVQPFRWRLVGAVSNNPINPTVTDFAAGIISDLVGGLTTQLAGLTASFLAGSDNTRSAEALALLLALMTAREPFDIDAGDIQLANMVITDIQRTKNPANEGGLVFEAYLQELPTLSTLASLGQPLQNQLRDGDPAKNQVAALIDKGERQLEAATTATLSAVGGLF